MRLNSEADESMFALRTRAGDLCVEKREDEDQSYRAEFVCVLQGMGCLVFQGLNGRKYNRSG